jgi:hypothetical protein
MFNVETRIIICHIFYLFMENLLPFDFDYIVIIYINFYILKHH